MNRILPGAEGVIRALQTERRSDVKAERLVSCLRAAGAFTALIKVSIKVNLAQELHE